MSGKVAFIAVMALLTLWIAGTFPVVAMLLLGLGLTFLFLVFGRD